MGALSSELNMDMKAQSSDCSIADKELAGIMVAMNKIPAKTAKTESRKRWIAKRPDGVRSMIVKEMEKALEYESANRERIRTRLHKVARQVKTPKEKGLTT